jgi:hypothetical protein
MKNVGSGDETFHKKDLTEILYKKFRECYIKYE